MRLLALVVLSGCQATEPGLSTPATPPSRRADAAPATAAPEDPAPSAPEPVGFSSLPEDGAQAIAISDAGIRDAAARGVPMILFRETAGDPYPPRPALVRAGVYLHDTKRFVPLAPVVRRSLGAIADGTRVAVVTGEDLEPGGITSIARARILTFGAPAVEPDATQSFDSEDVLIQPEVVPTRTGARIRIADFPPGAWPWKDLDATGFRRSESQAAPDRPWLQVTVWGTVLVVPAPPGFSIRNGALLRPEGEPIELGRGHSTGRWRSIAVAGDTAIVASVRADCPDGEGGVVRHFVDRVGLASGTVERLSQGDGATAIRIGPDGALYLQTDVRVRRFATPTARESEDLPAGFLLAVPLHPSGCDA